MNTILRRSIGALTMVSAVLIGPIGASAAQPEGIQGNVTVVNDASQPVPVEVINQENSREPYSVYKRVTGTGSGFVQIEFPSDKILVIEEVNSQFSCRGDFSEFPPTLTFGVKESSSSTPTGVMTLERYNATEISAGDFRHVDARFSGRLYAYPNSPISVRWRTDSCGFVSDVSLLVSGYLIPADS
jgi:hypothetical protein